MPALSPPSTTSSAVRDGSRHSSRLKQQEIPGIVIDADESDCLVIIPVENCARRQHRAIDLMQEVGTLRKRGYDDHKIAAKIGVTAEYVHMIAGLLEKGEERLVSAVETGLIPLNLAIEIARSDDAGAQRALSQAYTRRNCEGKSSQQFDGYYNNGNVVDGM